jgi:spore coat protein U-like protein
VKPHLGLARWPLIWIGILVLFLASQPARADTGECSATTSNIAFGTVTVSSMTGTAATGTVSVACPAGHGSYNPWAYCNSIGTGTNSVSQTNRTMTSGTNSISYNLYVDSGYATPYAYPGTTVYTAPYSNSTGGTATSTIYAKILATSPGIPPGTYTDSYTSATQAVVNDDGRPQTYSVAENCTGSTGSNWYNTLIFTVSVTLQPSCTVSVSALNFGSVPGPVTANVDATATITALCTATTPYAIGLDNGAHASGGQRQMLFAPSTYASYGLFTDSARANAWGAAASAASCTNGTNTCALGTGSGSNQTITIYGRVPPQSAVTAGSYQDSVVVTLTY